jgi:hypothetical protein
LSGVAPCSPAALMAIWVTWVTVSLGSSVALIITSQSRACSARST